MDNLKTKLGANYTKFFLWFNKEKVKNGNMAIIKNALDAQHQGWV